MEQLILHLFGDYLTQSDWMALNKNKRTWPAFCHASLYSLPFLLIGSPCAVAVIFGTHFFIDRYRLIRYVIYAKNCLGPTRPPWHECSVTGFHKSMPEWLATWLMIIADATLHLGCNYCALRWL
jgi:hypothetical protein